MGRFKVCYFKMLSNIDSQDMRIVRLRNKAKLEIGETNEDLIPERIQELKELIKEEGVHMII